MKLFGGKHTTKQTGGQRTAKSSPAPSKAQQKTPAPHTAPKAQQKPNAAGASGKPHRLNGTQRGLILLGVALVVLVAVIVGVAKAVIKPPERPGTNQSTSLSKDQGQKKPAFTYINDDGEEVEAQFEAPGSLVDGVYNILVVGTDKGSFLTDTIMIAHMDTVEHTVALMSVPRDTLVYGNYSVPKINSVYGGAGGGDEGIEALRQMLASMLGFEVDGYVEVNLEAFVEIIDLMGGVTFDVPQRMYYSDPSQNLYIDLYPGKQTLTGDQAIGVVRYRSGYAAGDIRRTEVQQAFVKAAAEQLFSLKTLANIQPIVESAIKHVKTDLTLGNMLYFAQEALKCDMTKMETFTLPGAGVYINGGSYYSLYPSQVLEIVNEYFNPYNADISLSSLHIRTSGNSSGGGSSSGSSSSSGSGSSSSGSSSSGGSSSGGSSGGSTTTTEPEDTETPETTDPSVTNPGTTDPGTTDPGTTDPGTTEPGTTDPGTTDPGTTDPGTTDPGTTDPGTTDPGATDPGTTDPGTTEPGTTDPGTTTDPDTTDPGTTTPPDGGETSTTTPDPVEPTDPGSGSSGVDVLEPAA